jgi:hypothetical protein
MNSSKKDNFFMLAEDMKNSNKSGEEKTEGTFFACSRRGSLWTDKGRQDHHVHLHNSQILCALYSTPYHVFITIDRSGSVCLPGFLSFF